MEDPVRRRLMWMRNRPVPIHAQAVALVVGISAYQNLPCLTATVRHATSLAERLQAQGFDKVRLLVDCTLQDLRRSCEETVDALGPGDLFLFYFTGHGLRDGLLGPIGAARAATQQSDLATAATYFSLHEGLLNRVRDQRAARLCVVIIDACRCIFPAEVLAAEAKRRELTTAKRQQNLSFPGSAFEIRDGSTCKLDAQLDLAEFQHLQPRSAEDVRFLLVLSCELSRKTKGGLFSETLLRLLEGPCSGLSLMELLRRTQHEVEAASRFAQCPRLLGMSDVDVLLPEGLSDGEGRGERSRSLNPARQPRAMQARGAYPNSKQRLLPAVRAVSVHAVPAISSARGPTSMARA